MTEDEKKPEDPEARPPLTEEQELVELETQAADSASSSGRRLFLAALLVVTCLAVIHLTPLHHMVMDGQQWKARIHGTGWKAQAIFFTASTLLIAAGLPRLFFCAVAGMLFGFWQGVGLGQLCALCGSYGTFLFARWSGHEWASGRINRNPKLRDLLRHPTAFSVFLVRQLPIAGVVPNLVLGLTSVKHRAFLVGSFWGFLPSTAMVATIGSGMGKHTLLYSVGQISGAMLALGGLSLLVWKLRKDLHARANAKRSAP